MNLTVPKYANLLICERALHSVGIVSEVLLCGLVIFLWEGGLWFAWKVLGVEGLEVILIKARLVKRKAIESLEDIPELRWGPA